MNTIAELKAQAAAIQEQIEAAQKAGRADAIAQIRALMDEHGIKVEDLAAKPRTSGKVPPKYRHPETGATWTGRGKPPTWIADKDRAQFAI